MTKASCPACGAGLEVVLKVVEPEPVPEKPVWLMHEWKTDGVPAPFHDAHFNASQRWSVYGIPADIKHPFGAEFKSAFKDHWLGKPFESALRLNRLGAVLDAGPLPDWILVDAERPTTEYTWMVVDFLREFYPTIQLGGGPPPWTGPMDEKWRKLDFLVCFRDAGISALPGYWGRMAEDFAHTDARLYGYRMPYMLFPQPVTKSNTGTVTLADAGEYIRALKICCRSPRGISMWGVCEFLSLPHENDWQQMLAAGTAPDWEQMLAAWDAAEFDPCDDRPKLYIAPQKNWRTEASMCRVAHHGGFRPEVDWTLATGDPWHYWDVIDDSAEARMRGELGGPHLEVVAAFTPPRVEFAGKAYQWGDVLQVWNDIGNPGRVHFNDAALREFVRGKEIGMGAELAAQIGE